MVTQVPDATLQTTQEATDMLNVFRLHLTTLFKEGQMKFEAVGKHRRVPLTSMINYREQKALRKDQSIQDLAQLGQEFDQG